MNMGEIKDDNHLDMTICVWASDIQPLNQTPGQANVHLTMCV